MLKCNETTFNKEGSLFTHLEDLEPKKDGSRTFQVIRTIVFLLY